MSEATNENPTTYRLSPIPDVSETQVSFPFEEQVWAKGFNHLQFVKGDQINVLKIPKDGKVFFQIIIPENPTLEQIIKATRDFIEKAEISLDRDGLLRLRIFCRDLRNSARVLAGIAGNFEEEKQKKALEFIDSLYQLGEGLEKKIEGEEGENASESTSFKPLDGLNDERLKKYELPSQETNLQDYKNNLLLFLLGKNYVSFAEANRQDQKLSQAAENSTYYSWFNRFIERKKRELERKIKNGQEIKDEDKIPQTYGKQIEEFDKYLLDNKEKLFSSLFPFIPENLQESGRGHTAFWEVVTGNIFSLLDQAIVEEGGQKAKEGLKPPLLFTDLGKEIQGQLKQLGLLSRDLKLDFEKYGKSLVSRLFFRERLLQLAINQIKQKAKDEKYGKMFLFQVAQEILKKVDQKILETAQPQPTVEEKIKILWDLVQAYEFKETYLLTSAVEEQAFECNLRSYILGRLLQQLMGNEVEVYTVNPVEHTLLLVFDKSDKSTNQAYWVDPTARRFYYVKNKRVSKYEKPFVYQVESAEWSSIQKQIKASPDNFHIFGNFTINEQLKFATILPFRQGIEAGFWSNFGYLKRIKFEKEGNSLSKEEKINLIKEAYYCRKKALELSPNDPDYHNNIALVYTEISLAEAMVREKYGIANGEELTEDQQKEVKKQYLLNLLQAEKHYQKALGLNPNHPYYHKNIALVYTKISLAEAMVREKYGITKGEELTEDQQKEVERQYYQNFNDAFQHMEKAYRLDPTHNRLDCFFWVIKKVPDDQARQVFEALTLETKALETKQLILQMYKIYQEKKPELRFGSNFENTQFWQLIRQWINV